MKNLEAKNVVTEDRYAYMNAETFKEFLELYPYDDSEMWGDSLMEWLMSTYVNDRKTFHHMAFNPYRVCWDNGGICIYEDSDTLDFSDFICELNYRRGDRYYSRNRNSELNLIRDSSATLNYARWRNRENTICWISLYWTWTDSTEQLFMDRINMTKNDKDEWERIFKMIQWVVWTVSDDGKTEGTEKIKPMVGCRAHAGAAIFEWIERNVDKLQ